jgi:signal transduction histidine kinase
MTIHTRRNSSRYSLIVILILALFIAAIFFYTHNNRLRLLSLNVNQLSQLDNDHSALDTCVLALYKADNNSRLFEVTGDVVYMRQFSKQITKVSAILDTLKIKHEADYNSENIKELIARKKAKIEMYLKLKQLTDSLFVINAQIDTLKQRTLTKRQEFTRGKFKTMVVIDTLKPTDTKHKGLIGRLADAFSRKKSKDTNAVLVRKEITLDTSLSSTNYNKMQIRNINTYFRNLYATNEILKDKEVAILRINSQIIDEIVSLLQHFKQEETNFVSETKKEIRYDFDSTFKSINHIYVVIFVLLLLLVVIILFNLWRIYRNENYLIDYGERVAQYAHAKSRFLANMSHEIRTPLNSVIGFSEQLAQENLSNQQKQQVEAIRTSSELLLDLVNDILDFSKYEVGKINFDIVSFTPAEAINEVLNSIAIQASRKGIKLDKQISFETNACVRGDSLRLKQLIMNLLSNAIKFTDQGSVTLNAELIPLSKKKSTLKVQVIDTGVGIEAKDIALIFDEFAQVHYSATRNTQKGTGLGLAICKRIAELQGGKISVVSELGKGSTFTFEIPYEICIDNANIEKTLAFSNVAHLAGKKILLVDDNKMNILLAQTVVKKYGIVTDTAGDGAEAYKLFENGYYDLVLTDVQMPLMGGVELTKLIRTNTDKRKANTPVLGVTANVMQEDRERYLSAGMNDLVLKPYSEKELIDKIASYVLG